MISKKLFYFVSLVLLVSSCQLSRFVFYNFADINDHKKFKYRTIARGSEAFTFEHTDKGKVPTSISYGANDYSFETFLEDRSTVAFLIIQNDTIQYEQYFKKYNDSSVVPSFSMAKSVTSILIGCAIADGYIQSVEEPITNYIPELKDAGFDEVTILHVLQMTTGIAFNESYTNPFGDAATFYYGTDLHKAVRKMTLDDTPGTRFAYASGNTQLLGVILERALKDQTISHYLQQKLWQPLQMEFDATWSIDRKNGIEKTFCCLNARARDYAKIGRLYLNQGNWNGQQIVPKNWVQTSTQIDETAGSKWYYQYQWWLPSRNGDFLAHGILGQYIYVNPAKNLVIVRLGKNEGKTNWEEVFVQMAAAY